MLDKAEAKQLRRDVGVYKSDLEQRFRQFIVGPLLPSAVAGYMVELDELSKVLSTFHSSIDSRVEYEIDPRLAPLLREVLNAARLKVAASVDARRKQVSHDELQAQLDAELAPYDRFFKAPQFLAVSPKPSPSLADYFPIERLQELAIGARTARTFDEKFHILQAPQLFLDDLGHARRAAMLREIHLAVAYVDIDRFKEFNTEKGEPFVDRKVLPKFMRTLEAHVFDRGYAYRYGGDEYAVLLNNVTDTEAHDSMNRLREKLAGLTYEGTQRRTTVSIGLVIVRPDCHLTGSEIEAAAAAAKQFAKQQGRDLVATFRPGSFLSHDLYVVGAQEPKQSA